MTNLGQDDHADAVNAHQPLHRPSFAAGIGNVVSEGLAPARDVRRIAVNDLFHPRLAFVGSPMDETAHHIGVRDEALQLVIVDHQNTLHRILDHQARQIAGFEAL